MSESRFTGLWTVTNPEGLGLVEDLTIEPGQQPGQFTITAPSSGLHLPDLDYDEEDDMLIGACQGRVRDSDNLYNVAVMIYGTDPDFKCKGVVFKANSSHREDNAVGTWTADKKGPIDPPPKR